MTLLIPDLVYVDGSFHSGLTVEVDTGSGRIHAVAPADEAIGPGERLKGRALIPGFTNVRCRMPTSGAGAKRCMRLHCR